MWKEEGFKGFMRGNGINCLRIVPYSAVQFTTYEQLKKVSNLPNHPSAVRLSLFSSLQTTGQKNSIPRNDWPAGLWLASPLFVRFPRDSWPFQRILMEIHFQAQHTL
jgi:hypothetical protein